MNKFTGKKVTLDLNNRSWLSEYRYKIFYQTGMGGGLLTSSKSSNPHILPGPGQARHKGFCFLEFEVWASSHSSSDHSFS